MKNFFVLFLFVENVNSFQQQFFPAQHSSASIWGGRTAARDKHSNAGLAAVSQYKYLADSSYEDLVTSIKGFSEAKPPPPTFHVALPDPSSTSSTLTAQYVDSIAEAVKSDNSNIASLPDFDQFIQSSKVTMPTIPEVDNAAVVEQWNQHLTQLGLQWDQFVKTFDKSFGQAQAKIDTTVLMANWNEFVQSTETARKQMTTKVTATASLPEMDAVAKWDEFVKSADYVVMDRISATESSMANFASSSQAMLHEKSSLVASSCNNLFQDFQTTLQGLSSTVASSFTDMVASSQAAATEMSTSIADFVQSTKEVSQHQATLVASSWTDMVSSTSAKLENFQNIDINLPHVDFDTSALVSAINTMTEQGQGLMHQLVHSSPYLEELASNGILAPAATASLGIVFVMAAASIMKVSQEEQGKTAKDHVYEPPDVQVMENLRQSIDELKTVEVDVHDLEVHLNDIEEAIADSVFTKDVTIEETENSATTMLKEDDKEPLGHSSPMPTLDEAAFDHFMDHFDDDFATEYDSSVATTVSTADKETSNDWVENNMEQDLDAFMSDDDLAEFEATFEAAQDAALRNEYLAGRLKNKKETGKINIGYVEAMGETFIM